METADSGAGAAAAAAAVLRYIIGCPGFQGPVKISGRGAFVLQRSLMLLKADFLKYGALTDGVPLPSGVLPVVPDTARRGLVISPSLRRARLRTRARRVFARETPPVASLANFPVLEDDREKAVRIFRLSVVAAATAPRLGVFVRSLEMLRLL